MSPDDIEILHEISEFLDSYSDVVDGDYGESDPNKAMSLQQKVDDLISRLEVAK